ncbi:MAG: TetR/AcrR family transcriptional regulator [Myxococcales bacterium]|nr:TetR/AcrR family transcriptional regulator [Myxococcales bacterium]
MSRRGPKPGEFEEPKQARTREQLARILEVTDELFAERGYQATKIADIAKAVPCSISTIYDRFGGKAELLRYMHRQGAEEAVALIGALDPQGEATGDLREVLPQAVRMGITILRRYRGRRRASLELMHVDPELAALELANMEQLALAGQRFLFAYRRQFQHPDPELAAQQAMRLLMAMTEQHGSSLPTPASGQLDEDRFVREVTRMTLAYLGVPRDY